MAEPLPPQYDPASTEAELYAEWEARGFFHAEAGAVRAGAAGPVRHRHPAAQRHGGAAHGARPEQHHAGRAHPLAAHAGPGGALPAGHGPRRHRHPERGGAAAGCGGEDPARTSAGRRSSSASGPSWTRPVPRSSSSCAPSAAPATGRAPASRWRRSSRRRCGRCSFGCTRRGSIYRGNYIINWCPRCLTALSDEEAEPQETHGQALAPPLPPGEGTAPRRGCRGCRTAGRTWWWPPPAPRPCSGTPRSPCIRRTRATRALVGAGVDLPLTGRRIPVVADAYVDPEFGSGAVKITPAHDPERFRSGPAPRGHGAARRDDARGAHERRRARAVPRAGPIRGARAPSWRRSRPRGSSSGWRTTPTACPTATGAAPWWSRGSRSSGSCA